MMTKASIATLDDVVDNLTSPRNGIGNLFDAKIEIVNDNDIKNIRKHKAYKNENPALKLDFEVMFPNGCDKLSKRDQARMTSLAKFLVKNPRARARLDGHADPRGSDEYNNVLAFERAKSVAKHLIDRGVKKENIDLYSHGANFACEIEAKRNHYAYERRVHIEILETNNK